MLPLCDRRMVGISPVKIGHRNDLENVPSVIVESNGHHLFQDVENGGRQWILLLECKRLARWAMR